MSNMIKKYNLNHFDVRVFQQPKAGMDCCGDSFFIKETEDFMICGIADGLGSGCYAKEASKAAVDILSDMQNESVVTMMNCVNHSQQNLRGVVMSLFKINLKSRQGYFCGVGNINMIINYESVYAQPLPEKGYISGKPLQYKVQPFHFPENGSFALFSDGIHIPPKQLQRLYRILDSPEEENVLTDLNTCSVRNLNDDATLIIGRLK